ncbi:MAG TPA: type II toxin-antitoxin system HicB family antitoxin [Spirochaetales bacterium]|nr:type II toxin-antitoxin system HicB family antitoxin [Spirochaetales bacterium]
MKRKVRFLHYDGYWIAEADNGAVSQGESLDECRENIKDAMSELDLYKNMYLEGLTLECISLISPISPGYVGYFAK